MGSQAVNRGCQSPVFGFNSCGDQFKPKGLAHGDDGTNQADSTIIVRQSCSKAAAYLSSAVQRLVASLIVRRFKHNAVFKPFVLCLSKHEWLNRLHFDGLRANG